ncbi:MAG: YidH family protein [Planctomycetota bacterium]|jgi:hypothetical protein
MVLIPFLPPRFSLQLGWALIAFGLMVTMFASLVFITGVHPFFPTLLFVLGIGLICLGLGVCLRSVYRRWFGGPSCQGCGSPSLRSFRDTGKVFAVCEPCLQELNSD